jgi:hypothetical protein
MKKLIVAAVLLLVVPAAVLAQNAEHGYPFEAYGFGAYEATLSVAGGGGGEWLFSKGIGLGGEFAKAVSPFGEYTVSANMYYHLGPSTNNRKFEPFVTGGYTLFYVPNVGLPHANGGNFGVGANIWLKKHAALRIEIRDTVGGRNLSIEDESYGFFYTAPQNVVSFRIGVTFR